jgi:hypothetical protein
MKKIAGMLLLFLIVLKGVSQSNQFDSVRVYSMPYYSLSIVSVNASLLMAQGDTTLITDKKLSDKIFIDLSAMKETNSNRSLKKLRQDFGKFSIDVRAVFVFYKGLNEMIIGISNHSLMFIDDLVFKKKDKRLEDIVKPSSQLYKSLFPTLEDILMK